jgi:hypothetical protein
MPRVHRTRPAAIIALVVWLAAAGALADPAEVHVYKSPDCGCCTKWIEHLRADGFSVRATDVPDVTPIKLEKGVPVRLAACHTAIVAGYVVEGHVPAADIRRLLREGPDIAGLAVPGMPIGSPGMEGPDPEPYEVLAFGARGVTVFAEHGPR